MYRRTSNLNAKTMNQSKEKTQTAAFSALAVLVIMISCSSLAFGKPSESDTTDHFSLSSEAKLADNDSIPFARVILYRPDNQLSRRYKLSTNTNGTFDLTKGEFITIEAHSNLLMLSVQAVGHKKNSYTFDLSQDKTHYFRIQDRNNYAGFRAFVEVIEVTETTFKRDTL